MHADLVLTGRLFQSRGAAAMKDRSPMDIATRAKETRVHTAKNAQIPTETFAMQAKDLTDTAHSTNVWRELGNKRNTTYSLFTVLLLVKCHAGNACSSKEPALLPVDVLNPSRFKP